jgi:hypothetical protein
MNIQGLTQDFGDLGYLKEGLSPLPWIYKFFTNSTSEQGILELFQFRESFVHELPTLSLHEIGKW